MSPRRAFIVPSAASAAPPCQSVRRPAAGSCRPVFSRMTPANARTPISSPPRRRPGTGSTTTSSASTAGRRTRGCRKSSAPGRRARKGSPEAACAAGSSGRCSSRSAASTIAIARAASGRAPRPMPPTGSPRSTACALSGARTSRSNGNCRKPAISPSPSAASAAPASPGAPRSGALPSPRWARWTTIRGGMWTAISTPARWPPGTRLRTIFRNLKKPLPARSCRPGLCNRSETP